MVWTGVFVTLPNRTSLDKIAVFTFSISPIQTEILAIKEVVQWSLSHDYNVEYIFSDCINACRLQERIDDCFDSQPHNRDFEAHSL